jgi:hypothetical protein
MIQRPQSIFFFAAFVAILVAAFVPIARYSLEVKNAPEDYAQMDPHVVVRTSRVALQANHVPSMGPKEEMNEWLESESETLNQQLSDRGMGMFFTIGFGGTLLLAIVALVTIFLYRNRRLQIRMGYLIVVVCVLTTIGIFITSQMAMNVLTELNFMSENVNNLNWVIGYKVGFFLFPAAAVLALFGTLRVRKDEDLVKSLDRIR